MAKSRTIKALEIITKAGVMRPNELEKKHRISRQYLYILYNRGLVTKIGRGLYKSAESEPSEFQSLIEVCTKVPKGVLCLLSALRFHELTTQAPFEIWMALGKSDFAPRLDMVKLRVVRYTGRALKAGIVVRNIAGVKVRVYNPAKTVADCFKYRNKIGLEVALEALRDCWKKRRATMDDIWKYAKICRVANVMKPYLESLVK